MASAVARIAEFVDRVSREEFEHEWTLQNALIRELEILGEAAGKLSGAFVTAGDDGGRDPVGVPGPGARRHPSRFGVCQQMSFVFGAPPKVIWLRLGNCSIAEIEDALRAKAGQIEVFGADAESSYLIL